MIPKKIGVFIEDEWVAISYNSIINELVNAGFQPVLITTNRTWDEGKRRSIPVSKDEPVSFLTADLSMDEVNIEEFSGFVFGGGYWADRLRWWFMKEKSPGVLERPEPRALVENILRSDRHLVGTICHSIWLLCSLKKAVKSREVTCAYNIIDDARNAGFIYIDADVHVDGNLITGRMSFDTDAFIKEFIRRLNRRNCTPASTGS